MRIIKIVISYDGTNYCGWQRQKNATTVQEVIEKNISKQFKQKIELMGASRTDAGVHANGQVATFRFDSTIPTKNIPMALNAVLPKDIVIQDAEEVDEHFHPRYLAKRKTYRYQIYNGKYMMPQYRNYMLHQSKPLDEKKMQEAAKAFIGHHDFIGFSSSGRTVKTTDRTIYDFSIKKNGNIIDLEITGNGFLYNMVRIIAGTMIFVGIGKIKPEDMASIIASKERTLAGTTALPQGLTLMNIEY